MCIFVSELCILYYQSICLSLILHFLDYYRFILSLTVRNVSTPPLFFFKADLVILGLLKVHTTQLLLISLKEPAGILFGIAVNLEINFGRMDILKYWFFWVMSMVYLFNLVVFHFSQKCFIIFSLEVLHTY